MEQENSRIIARELGLESTRVGAVLTLLTQGGTVPFIARYRKEATGSLDEVAVATIRDRSLALTELAKRKTAVSGTLEKLGKLSSDLAARIRKAGTLAELEDIYLPHRPKRKTRGVAAREKGLSPLARSLLAQKGEDPRRLAAPFVNPDKDVPDIEAALSGARDIIAEVVNEDPGARRELRRLFRGRARITTRVARGKEIDGEKFRNYFDVDEPAAKAPSHRVLAMFRAEREKILGMKIAPPPSEAEELLLRRFVRGSGEGSREVAAAVKDAYKRLLAKSMETEIRGAVKERADKTAIGIFSENLRQLLLAPPLGPKRVMGVDPGFASGCKVACLTAMGGLIEAAVVFPHSSEKNRAAAGKKIVRLCKTHCIEAVGVGNGTAGRETLAFIEELPELPEIPVIQVNESGASVYSASEIAREEFPDEEITVRGTVSIARRLMDPLSELVKIDPKAIGVGQYQHDVDQNALKESLDDVVISCVNNVGVDLNGAGKTLLSYVSGLGPKLAENIVTHREKNGPFKTRKELLKVPRLGPSAFLHSAPFLRIKDGANPLDASSVHPERYKVVNTMARDMGCTVVALMADPSLRAKIDLGVYVTDDLGLPTLTDIMAELAKPGLDPRSPFETFRFQSGVEKPSDLKKGMTLPGVVTNITAFGAFVDIGVHRDGLVHISEMADKFVKDPAEVVRVHEKVTVKVLEVDLDRNRITLSMKGLRRR